MIHLGVYVIALILTSTSALDLCSDRHKGPCKKTSQCEPSVIPMNSTHLLVNWENVFSQECEESHIDKIEVVEIVNLENVSKINRNAVSRSQKETVVLADPCLAHIIGVSLFMTDDYSATFGRSFLQSPLTEYNKIEQGNEKYPFGGLLGIKVVPQICLKANGTITIPSPPEALKNCEIRSVGVTGTVRFTFKSPQSPSKISYKNFAVKDIKACTSDHSRESGNMFKINWTTLLDY